MVAVVKNYKDKRGMYFRLSCGHIRFIRIRPRKGDTKWCPQCDDHVQVERPEGRWEELQKGSH